MTPSSTMARVIVDRLATAAQYRCSDAARPAGSPATDILATRSAPMVAKMKATITSAPDLINDMSWPPVRSVVR